MKKNYTHKLMLGAVAVILLLTGTGKAQPTVASYNFTQFQGTYSAITGGTLIQSAVADDNYYCDPNNLTGGATTGPGFVIGFNFTFAGVVYDRFAVQNNGWISLGQSSLSPAVNLSPGGYTGISGNAVTTPTTLGRHIAALSRDLDGRKATSNLRAQTIGTAPNRTCVIQWTDYTQYSSASNPGSSYNFQIHLVEGSNFVNVVYGTMVTSAAITNIEVGLRGSATDYNNRVVASGGNWVNSTAGTANTAVCYLGGSTLPVSGLTYQWYQAVPCNGSIASPTIGAVGSGVSSLCLHAGETASISTEFGAGPPLLGVTYNWMESSSPSGPFSPVSGGTLGVFGAYQTANMSANAVYYQLEAVCASANVTVVSNVFGAFPNPTITLSSQPALNLTLNPLPVCSNNIYDITASGAVTYTWNNGLAQVANVNPFTLQNPVAAFPNYTVSGVSAEGCVQSNIITLDIMSAPIVFLNTTSNSICEGDNTLLVASGTAYSYAWAPNINSNAMAITVAPTSNTEYTVVATAVNGCTQQATQGIIVNPPPVISVITSTTPGQMPCAKEEINLAASGAVTYTWISNDTYAQGVSIVVKPKVSTIYYINGIDQNNCFGSTSINLVVDACVGIAELNANEGVNVYPNPNSGEFVVELNDGSAKSVELYDLTGRMVLSNTASNNKVNININHLSNGVYYLKVTSDSTTKMVKVVKQ